MKLGDWSFSFSTRLAMLDGYTWANTPGISMELLKSHRYDEVLRAECQSEGCANFSQLLPEILNGERPDWFLRDVEVKVDCLTLLFASRESSSTQAQAIGPSGHVKAPESYSMYPGVQKNAKNEAKIITGTVRVNNPTVVGLRFTVPPFGGQPEIVYECMMSSSGTGHSHSLQLTENYVDPQTGKTVQNNLHFGQSKS